MNDITARQRRLILYIGDDQLPLNITNTVIGNIIPKDSALDIQGFIVTSCTITLIQTPDLNINPKVNRSRFAVGNKITIEVQDSTGAWKLVTTQRILRRQYKSGKGVPGTIPTAARLILQCGDRLLLRDTRNPPTDEPDIAWNGPRSLVSYLNQWLNYFDLPELTFTEDETVPPETIQAPVPYNGGTIVAYLGKLLYAQGRYHIYCDRHEQLRLTRINLAPEAATLIATPPELPIYLESEVETEMPPAVVTVIGTANTVIPRTNPNTQTTVYTNDVISLTETVDISYTNTSEETIREGIITISGLSFNSGDVDTGHYKETTLKTYNGSQGQLTQISSTFEEEGTAPENGSSFGLITTETNTVDYEYNDIVIKSKTETLKSLRRALENGNNSGDLLLDQSTQEEWAETLPGKYSYRRVITIPSNEKPIITKSLSKSGESEPPSTDFAPPTYTIETEQIEEEKKFKPTEDTDIHHRIEVNHEHYLSTNRALNKAIAQEQGALIYGRDFSQDMGWLISDEELENPTGPLIYAWIQYDETEQDVYLINSRVTFIGESQFYYGGAGIWLGRRNIETGEITPPYLLKAKVLATLDGQEILTLDGRVIELI